MKEGGARWVKGLVIGFCAVVLIGIVFVWLFFTGGFPDIYRNVGKYREALSSHGSNTRFLVFPEEIPESGLENAEFYYFFQDTFGNPTLEVCLRCTYGEEDFQAEIERLEHAKLVTKTGERLLMRDEGGRFSYPAYIAILDRSSSAEYALITGEREITYIYYQMRKPGSFRKIPSELLPEPFEISSDHGKGFSVYTLDE